MKMDLEHKATSIYTYRALTFIQIIKFLSWYIIIIMSNFIHWYTS